MRILVMGSGGIGGYYGARLARAGNEVVFVARGPHLEAMQANGLEIHDRDGSVWRPDARAVRYPAEAGGTFDLILFAVKTYDTREAAEAIRPVVGPETCIVPIQNGVDSVEEIGRVVDPARVLAGSTLLSSTIVAPGVVQQLGTNLSITIGEPTGPRSARVERIVATFHAAGIDQAVATDDAQQGLWEKFMFLAPCASINSASGLSTGGVFSTGSGSRCLPLGATGGCAITGGSTTGESSSVPGIVSSQPGRIRSGSVRCCSSGCTVSRDASKTSG